jgi:hypothetical protein
LINRDVDPGVDPDDPDDLGAAAPPVGEGDLYLEALCDSRSRTRCPGRPPRTGVERALDRVTDRRPADEDRSIRGVQNGRAVGARWQGQRGAAGEGDQADVERLRQVLDERASRVGGSGDPARCDVGGG